MGKDFYSLLCKSKCTALSFSFVRALLYAQTSLSLEMMIQYALVRVCIIYSEEEDDDDEEEEEPKEPNRFFQQASCCPFFLSKE